jgi:4-hydroxy-tetrahydrodipicolinate reductase
MEILDYSTYMQAHTLFEIMGFGKPLDETPLLLLPGVLTHAWGGVVRMIADAAGARLDEIREWHERLPAAHDFELNGMGIIARGTQASLRFQLQGMVDGRAAIVIEHVTRTAADQAPDWPRGHGMGSYRIEIAGAPRIACDFHLEGPDGDHNTGGLLASALRVVNAIPAVVAAPPGLLSPLDLPLIVPKGVFG